MPTRRCLLLLCLLGGFVLSGCAGPLADRTVEDPYGGAQVMAAEGGMLRLPPDWEQRRLLTLRQVEDGVLTEQAILANDTATPRENVLRVRTRWRGPGTYYGVASEMPSPFTSEAVRRRLESEFGGLQAPLEPQERRNGGGSYLYVPIDLGEAGSCIYAWQVRDEVTQLRGESHSFAVDLRMCRPGSDSAPMLALFDAIELAPRL